MKRAIVLFFLVKTMSLFAQPTVLDYSKHDGNCSAPVGETGRPAIIFDEKIVVESGLNGNKKIFKDLVGIKEDRSVTIRFQQENKNIAKISVWITSSNYRENKHLVYVGGLVDRTSPFSFTFDQNIVFDCILSGGYF